MEAFELNAEVRTAHGTSANRRLRRQGRVPAIIYGGKGDPVMLSVDHDHLAHHLENEAFFSHIIKINVDGGSDEEAVLRDLQRHPARPFIEHMDLMRVVADETLRMSVPLHFAGDDQAPGVVEDGGIFELAMTELEVECLPRHLPEYIEVDVSHMTLSDAVHLSEVKVPENVTVVDLMSEDAEDATIVTMSLPRGAVAEEEEAEAEGEAEEGAEQAAEAGQETDEDAGSEQGNS